MHTILLSLQPFVRFKRVQVAALIAACDILLSTSVKKLTTKQLRMLVSLIVKIQNENYVTKKKRSKEELYVVLGLTP